MTKSAVSDWDTDPDQNTDVGGLSLNGAVQVVSQLDNIIREVMAQIASAGFITSVSPVTTFSDSDFAIQDNGDATKQLKFEVSGITTGTTRTATPPDANFKMAALDVAQQTLAGGVNVTVKDLGALSAAGSNTITPNPGDRPIQKITNDHAGSILPGSNNGSYLLEILNTTGAGALTTTGWTLKGDSFDTTTTSKFLCACIVADVKLMTVTKVA